MTHSPSPQRRPITVLTILIVLVLVFLAVIVLSSCTQKTLEPFRDAPRGSTNSTPADVLTYPDGFSNVAAKCDGPNRVYVIFKGDKTYGSVAVVADDPRCGR